MTLALIRRAVVERRGWVSEEAFASDWALCQLCPGINLIALAILLGRRIAGVRGILLCLVGLLLPSVAATVLMTALYAYFQSSATVKAALRAVVPASVGLGLLTAGNVARAPLQAARRDGRGFFLFALLLIPLSGAALYIARAPVVAVLLSAGAASALLHALRPTNSLKGTIRP